MAGKNKQSKQFAQLQGYILLGLILFAGYVFHNKGLIGVLLTGDRSYLSYVILVIWLMATLRWLWLLNWCAAYDPIDASSAGTASAETQADMVRWVGHGWFAADLCLKIGLLGTIVGFIFMLSPIRDLTAFDPSNLQSALRAMSGGMAVALYTTLAGLSCHLLLRVQYQLLADAMQKLGAEEK